MARRIPESGFALFPHAADFDTIEIRGIMLIDPAQIQNKIFFAPGSGNIDFLSCPERTVTGNFLNDPEFSFKGGYKQSVQTLLCLETQHMPDSINHENFTDCTLSPDEVYDFTTEYRFSVK